MMLANDDFGVDAEVPWTAENFDDAAGGRGAAAREMQEFDVDDRAVELGDVRKAFAARRGRKCELFTESGCEFVARREFDFGLHARVVGNHDRTAGDVAKLSDDGGMCAIEDANDAAFGAARTALAAEARDPGDDVVTVHGVVDIIAGDEEVAVEIGNRYVGNDEAIAIVVENEAARNFVARRGLMLHWLFGSGRIVMDGVSVLAGGAKPEAGAGKFFDKATLLELGEHFKECAAIGPLDLQASSEVVEGNGIVLKFKKTKDVIGAELRRPRHGRDPFPGNARSPLRFYSFFFHWL